MFTFLDVLLGRFVSSWSHFLALMKDEDFLLDISPETRGNRLLQHGKSETAVV